MCIPCGHLSSVCLQSWREEGQFRGWGECVCGVGEMGGAQFFPAVIQSQLRLINCCHFNPLSQIP